MKTLSQSIREFISDFNLYDKEHDTICFDAQIYFSTVKNYFKLETEVQIITVNGLAIDAVYLLSPEIIKKQIPDMFFYGKEKFEYMKGTALVIKGQDVTNGVFIVSIHPENNNCSEETLQEIHSKKFN